MTPSRRDLWFLVAGAVLISFSAVFVKLAPVGATTAAFYRVFFGGVILAVVVLVRRERLWRGAAPLAFAAACAVFFALDLTLWHRSIYAVGPGLATILANFQVLVVGAVGILFLKERLTWRWATAVPLALLGLFLMVGVTWSALPPGYRLGVAFGLGTALCYSGYLLTLRRAQARPSALSPTVFITYVSLACAALVAVIALASGEGLAVPGWRAALPLVAYGVAGQVLGWVFIARSIAAVPASRAGLILLLQPALSFVWDALFFGRPVSGWDAAGAALALGAIYLGTAQGRGPGGV